MALFESYERRVDKINAVLAEIFHHIAERNGKLFMF